MTVSHVSITTILKTLTIAAMLFCIPLKLVEAQSGPVRLAPQPNLRPGEQSTVTLPVMEQKIPETVVTDSLDTSIQVNTLQTINPDTAGVLSAQEGGFGVGMWDGTSQRMLATMIRLLPVNNKSKAMRDLIIQHG